MSVSFRRSVNLNIGSFARCAICLHAASKGVSNGTGHCVICPLVSNGAWPEMPLQLCRSGLQLSVCVPRLSSKFPARHIGTRLSLITSKLDGSATSPRKVRQPCICSLFTLASSNFHSTALPAAASPAARCRLTYPCCDKFIAYSLRGTTTCRR